MISHPTWKDWEEVVLANLFLVKYMKALGLKVPSFLEMKDCYTGVKKPKMQFRKRKLYSRRKAGT